MRRTRFSYAAARKPLRPHAAAASDRIARWSLPAPASACGLPVVTSIACSGRAAGRRVGVRAAEATVRFATDDASSFIVGPPPDLSIPGLAGLPPHVGRPARPLSARLVGRAPADTAPGEPARGRPPWAWLTTRQNCSAACRSSRRPLLLTSMKHALFCDTPPGRWLTHFWDGRAVHARVRSSSPQMGISGWIVGSSCLSWATAASIAIH